MEKSKALVSVKAYLPNDLEIESIIKLCNLFPTSSWRVWSDYSGNNIQILNNRKVISFKDHPLNQGERMVTDLYYKSHPKEIAKKSKWALIAFGEGDKHAFNICYIWFLGKDDRLRLVSFIKNEWVENSLPLSSGIKTLRTVIKYLGMDEVVSSHNIKPPGAAEIVKVWATSWPPNNNTKLDLMLSNAMLAEPIKGII